MTNSLNNNKDVDTEIIRMINNNDLDGAIIKIDSVLWSYWVLSLTLEGINSQFELLLIFDKESS